MRSYLPVLLFAFAGILAGGAISLYRQQASRIAVVVTGFLAALATAGGVLWLLPSA